MIIRILLLLFSLILLVNLCIVTVGYLMGKNLYKIYGKQMLIIFGCFVLLVTALYTAIALIGLK